MKISVCSVLGTLTFHLLTVVVVVHSRGVVQHATSTCKNYHAELKCPKKYGIAIKTINYGTHREYCDKRAHGMEHCCSPLVDDCIFAHKAAILSMNTYCSGLDSCIGSSEPTGQMPDHRCGFDLSYMKVNYDCIPDKTVSEFCEDTTHTGNSLYISSPAYPSSMRGGNSSCNCLVTAGRQVDVNISVQAIDILFTGVGYRPRICEQKLTIRAKKNGNKNVSIDCNGQKMYGFREIFHGDGNKWLLTLNSHYASNRGRVWLLVKATDNRHRLTVRCGPSVEWNEQQTAPIPGIGESTRKYIGIGILAGTALSICVVIMLIVTAVCWHCRTRRKSVKLTDKEKKILKASCESAGEKPPPVEDITNRQQKTKKDKKGRKSSKSYATVPRNMESKKEHNDGNLSSFGGTSLQSFPQSPTASSQQEFLHDYSVPPPPAGPYENVCMSSATFPRGRPLVPDPYAQYYATIQPRNQRLQFDPSVHSASTPWEPAHKTGHWEPPHNKEHWEPPHNTAPDDEEWPPPYVPEEANTVENALYDTARSYY